MFRVVNLDAELEHRSSQSKVRLKYIQLTPERNMRLQKIKHFFSKNTEFRGITRFKSPWWPLVPPAEQLLIHLLRTKGQKWRLGVKSKKKVLRLSGGQQEKGFSNCDGLRWPVTQAMKKWSNCWDSGDVALVRAIMKTQNKESKDRVVLFPLIIRPDPDSRQTSPPSRVETAVH